MSDKVQLRLIDLIIDQAEVALASQNKDGSMPAGCNGPYKNPETPVRNTAHWLMTFSWLYRTNPDQHYLDAADRLATYLADPAHRPYGFSFHCRNEAMDHCNGLIGQAWAMEGLAEATRLFSDQRFARIALDVLDKHEFDRRHGVWLRLEPDGRVIGEDRTFNHQLWFAATAAEVLAAANVTDHPHLMRFMEKLKDNLTVLEDGRIQHLTYHTMSAKNIKKMAKRPVGSVCRTLGITSVVERLDLQEQGMIPREIGYQCFNLYAFARLAHIFSLHNVLTSKPFQRAMTFLESEEYRNAIQNNPYSYGYNAPGFEVPFCLTTFSTKDRGEIIREAHYWINTQISLTYNWRTRGFARNTEDSETLNARIYECTRLPEDILMVNVNDAEDRK